MNELREEIERVLLQITPEDLKKAKDDEIARGGEKGVSLNSRAAIYSLDRQLKSSLAANREQIAEIERLNLLDSVVLLWRAEKAESELASLRASVGEKPEDAWIEIKEGCKMPMSGDRVLVYEHGTVFFAYFQSARKSWIGDLPDVFLDSNDGHFTAVTHWRTLPVAPTLPGEEK